MNLKVYVISYDLNVPGQNYNDLYEGIKKFEKWMHYLDSTWFIQTEKSAEEAFESLKEFIDTSDRLIVIEVQKNWYARLPDKALDWLKTAF